MTQNLQADVYLVPLPIGTDSDKHFHTVYLTETIVNIPVWISENARTLRRFLSSLKLGIVIDDLTIFESNHRTAPGELDQFLAQLDPSLPLGVVSEAGIPCIADPGNRVVAWAHRKNRTIIPLLGPNSIIMALQSSGFNGQQFIFHGYPPVNENEFKNWLKNLSGGLWKNYTHAFIETPYRSDKTYQILVKNLPPMSKLCVAANLHEADEIIKSQYIHEWRKTSITWGKIPAVWVISFEP